MSKWKCEICGTEFKNFHAQGFEGKIYCPLCYFKKENLELRQENQKYKEVIDKAIELLGNYKHYSTPDEKQNSDNEDLVNKAFDVLKEVK